MINIFADKENNKNDKIRTNTDDKINNKKDLKEKNIKAKSQLKKWNKYKKFSDKNLLNKFLENIEIKEKDNNIYQYQISNFYLKTNSANYYCSDTGCSGKIKIIYDFNKMIMIQ